MGVESFYIVSKISNNKSPSEILKCLENRNFSIVRHTLIFGSIFKKKVTSDNEFVINDLIIFSIDANDNLSFRACFSCYSKAIGIIVDIISTLQNAQFIENISYGSDVVSLADKSKDTLRSIIFDMHSSRYSYFQSNYTSTQIDLLPDEFYSYYMKHRKALKKHHNRHNIARRLRPGRSKKKHLYPTGIDSRGTMLLGRRGSDSHLRLSFTSAPSIPSEQKNKSTQRVLLFFLVTPTGIEPMIAP